jgi:AraC-like DNA-binding protein
MELPRRHRGSFLRAAAAAWCGRVDSILTGVAGCMDYREHAAPHDLAPYVRCLWTLEGRGERAPLEPILPDGCFELGLHWREPFERVALGERRVQPYAFFVGQIRSPFIVVPSGAIGVVAARFRIGGAAPWLCGTSASAFTGREVELDLLAPRAAERLVERLAEAADAAERVTILGAWLRASLCADLRSSSVATAGAWLERTSGRGRVDALARHVDLGTRQLERLFEREVGASPKQVSRILRFQRLLGRLRERPADTLASHAAWLGYADEAHLVREFRHHAGVPPRTWQARATPLAAHLSGYAG